ncbi:MAG: lysine--tRNA ligase [Candidatus Paceibacterota bacterium]|jgi:lysyl-tRNA synthetase class 2
MSQDNAQTPRNEAIDVINGLREAGINPYPERFEKNITIGKASTLDLEAPVNTAGRIILFRTMGKLTFAHIQDFSGKMQIVLKEDVLGQEKYKSFTKTFRPGDFIGVNGKIFVTKVGEKSIMVENYMFLGKALLPLPEKWAGLKDQETKYRQRYLDLIANPESMKGFVFRSELVSKIREYYSINNFLEVETPTLMHSATGAIAKPYKTHNNALDIDLYLRISHELPLKTLIVGGFDRIFEIGKAFRNEGVDVSHLPEHTHLEHYAAYWNYEDNIDFIEKMFMFIFEKMKMPKKIKMEDGVEIDFSSPWPRLNFIDLMKEKTGIDIMKYENPDELRKVVSEKGHKFEDIESMSVAGIIDHLYKKIVRPTLVNPTILYYYPIELQPLARRNDKDPKVVDQFQLIINGWEIVKAYSELVDPVDQEQRFVEQVQSKERGEEEVMEIDSDYIEAMSYGMPPISGLGIGIDRLVALLLGKSNLRDIVFFPLLRPKDKI